MYFYELHEGDEDLMTDVILARGTEMSRAEFLALVREIHESLQDSFEEDSLIEAIAAELEREHDFTFVSDDRIVAAVHVSASAAKDALIAGDEPDAPVHADDGRDEEDELDEGDDDDADLDELPDYLTIVADMEPPSRLS